MTIQQAKNTLSIKEKADIKRALIRAGVNPSGMDDSELLAAMAKLESDKSFKAPAPAPAPKAEGKAQEEKPKTTSKTPAQLSKLEILAQLLSDDKPAMDESRIIELIKQHSGVAPISYEIKQANKPTIKIDNAHFQFQEVLDCVTAGVNVYLAGGAGAGKTTIAEHVAKALDVPFHPVGAIFQKYELTGYNDANGIFRTTEFRQAFEHGGVFLFDEMDSSDASALVAFNAAIANGFFAFPDKIVKKHAHCYVIGAANTKGKGATREYTGRVALDASTMDRYVIIDIEYDLAIEQLVVNSMLADKPILAAQILETVRSARDKARELQLSCVISPRCCYDSAKLVANGIAINKALTYCLWNKLDNISRTQLGG